MKFNDKYAYNQYMDYSVSKRPVNCRLCDNKKICFVIDAMNKNMWNHTKLNFCSEHSIEQIKDYLFEHLDKNSFNSIFWNVKDDKQNIEKYMNDVKTNLLMPYLKVIKQQKLDVGKQ